MTNDEMLSLVRHKLREGVPLIGQMQLDVIDWQPGLVTVEAPLAPNINTHGTAFGGSLYCVASMAGWSLMHLTLMSAGFLPSVWVMKGEISYRRPVRGVLRATASMTPEACGALIESFGRAGKAKSQVDILMQEEGQDCVQLSALFAAVTQDP